MADPIVFLPAMMCDARQFWPQIVAFSPTRAVHVAPLTSASTVGALAASVLNGAPRRFAVVGTGLGGVVAMEVVRRAPERVTRVALISTTHVPETPQRASEREPQIILARTGRLDQVIKDQLAQGYLAAGAGRGDIRHLLLDMAANLGVDAFVSQCRAMQRRPDQQTTLRGLRVPILLVAGAEDRISPVKDHEFMAKLIPDARLEIVAGAGHLPGLEQAETVNGLLDDWLDAPLVLR